jgi:hypothetical protein
VIYSKPSASFAALLDASGRAGLVGTLTVQLEKTDGSTAIAPTTSGITEVEPGIYAATLTAPAIAATYIVVWNDAGLRAAEELTVTATPPETVTPTPTAFTYATPQQVRTALAPDDDTSGGTAASLSDSQLIDALVEATNEIDAMVAGAPFSAPVPRLIVSLDRDIGAYLATLAYRKGNPLPPEHPVALRYSRAEMLLAKATRGELDLSEDSEVEAGGDVAVVNQYEGDLFSLDSEGIGADNRALPPWMGGWDG